jgi:hypothetical protein
MASAFRGQPLGVNTVCFCPERDAPLAGHYSGLKKALIERIMLAIDAFFLAYLGP